MRADQDRRGGDEARQGASRHRPAAVDELHRRSRRTPTASPPPSSIPAARRKSIPGRYHRQRRGRAQHHPQGPRHRVRGLHLFRPHAQHRGRLRFPPARLHRAQLHLRSRRVVEPVPLARAARPLARAFPDQGERDRRGIAPSRGVAAQAAGASCRPARISRSSAATSTPCISGSRPGSAPAARSSPATPRM